MQTDMSAKESFYAEAEQFLKTAIEVEEHIEKRNDLNKRIESASMRRDELANALRNRLDKMQPEPQLVVFAGCVVIVAMDGVRIDRSAIFEHPRTVARGYEESLEEKSTRSRF